ncbi:MAG: flagellar P-ring protein FlgI [Pirellulaceae bacterium]|nr:MAG: flagellar P-ring protein FlgI [Pirellulaceae bacterium]
MEGLAEGQIDHWATTMASRLYALALVVLLTLLCDRWLAAQVRVADVCRVKGQEENIIHGFGLVVGLRGTGDGDRPATRALAQTMQLMGNAIPRGASGDFDLNELKNAKNVALVFVTATIPPTGGRQGGRINCTVSAISAKSLAGGTLLLTPLLGPLPSDRNVYGVAFGPLTIPDPAVPTVATIHQGCQLQRDFVYQFQQDGYVTLVLKENHAGFRTALLVQSAVNQGFNPQRSMGDYARRSGEQIAWAIDARNVLVRIPDEDRDRPVEFIAELLNFPIELREIPGTRVVINERAKVIVVGDEVAIRPVAISHKNLTIDAGGQQVAAFTTLERPPAVADSSVALRSLVTALNGLKVDTSDIIDIIKALDRQGALWGELVIE